MDATLPFIGDVHVHGLLFQVVVVLSLAVLLGLLFRALGQSPFVGYLAAGLLLGPAGFNLDADAESFEMIGETAAALLLFAIGLELPWQRLKSIGRVALVGGVSQMLITAAVGYGLLALTGLSATEAIAAGLAVSLSSTAAVLRVLMERGELDAVHGRAALGVLIAQDIATVVFLMIVQELGGDAAVSSILGGIGISAALVVFLGVVLFLTDRAILRPVLHHAASTTDREFLSILSITISLGAVGFADVLGLSLQFGGFLAGVVIGDAPYASRVRSEILPLRTALLALFFSHIGMLVDPAWMADNLMTVTWGVLGVLIIKPVIAMLALRMAGVAWIPAFLAGAALGQVGEFSFVVVAASLESGALSGDAFQVFAAVSLVSLVVTPWMLSGAHAAVNRRRDGTPATEVVATETDHIVVAGTGTTGFEICTELIERGETVAAIDLHHKSITRLENLCTAIVGDAGHADELARTGAAGARAIIVTVPDPVSAKAILRAARTLNEHAVVIVRGRYHRYIPQLENAGATVIVDEELTMASKLIDEVLLQ